MHIQVRLVDLVYISCKNEFAAFPGTGNDRLDFVRGKVLGLIYYEEYFR